MKVFGIVAAFLGLVLLVLSTFWVSISPSSWTPEKAEQWAATKDRLHNLSFTVNAPPPGRSLLADTAAATRRRQNTTG